MKNDDYNWANKIERLEAALKAIKEALEKWDDSSAYLIVKDALNPQRRSRTTFPPDDPSR